MMYDQTVDEVQDTRQSGEQRSFVLPQPAVQIIKGRRKTSTRQEKGKHIDCVYSTQMVDEIEKIVNDENIATTSILMRRGMGFYLMIRRRAKPGGLIVIYDETGNALLKIPTEEL